MTTSILLNLSEAVADTVAALAPCVVQVQGRRQPASGVLFADAAVLTTARALGADEGLRVRPHEGHAADAEFGGWDPATDLAVLRVPGITVPRIEPAEAPPRVGQLAIALARSWSNAITASLGNIAIIGGPLRTGRHRAIDEVIRTTAPMHEGFAGGPLVGADGRAIGICTAATIRGFGVVIPSAIAWKVANDILAHGSPKRGFLGVTGQPVRLADRQRDELGRDRALLVAGVTSPSPAETAGVLVGDVIFELDGQPVQSAEDLLDLLRGERVGRKVNLRVLRGGTRHDVMVVIAERPRS